MKANEMIEVAIAQLIELRLEMVDNRLAGKRFIDFNNIENQDCLRTIAQMLDMRRFPRNDKNEFNFHEFEVQIFLLHRALEKLVTKIYDDSDDGNELPLESYEPEYTQAKTMFWNILEDNGIVL